MTTVDVAPVPTTAAPAWGPAARWAVALLLPVGPAAIAALRYLLPYFSADGADETVAAVAASEAAQDAVVWLGFVALLTLVPGVIWAGSLVRPRAPRLATWAMVLLVPAYCASGFLVATDAILLFGVRNDLPAGVVFEMYESLHPAIGPALGIFVVGHVVGTVLLGIAMVRSRVVPVWAGVVTAVAQPLHFLAFVVLGVQVLDLAAWGLNAVGFAALSVAVIRSADSKVAATRG